AAGAVCRADPGPRIRRLDPPAAGVGVALAVGPGRAAGDRLSRRVVRGFVRASPWPVPRLSGKRDGGVSGGPRGHPGDWALGRMGRGRPLELRRARRGRRVHPSVERGAGGTAQPPDVRSVAVTTEATDGRGDLKVYVTMRSAEWLGMHLPR